MSKTARVRAGDASTACDNGAGSAANSTDATRVASGRKSRSKGQNGEREIAGILADLTGWAIKRKVRQHGGDSDLEGVPGWCVEVKRHRVATRGLIAQWWAQAVKQAEVADLAPVLFFRQDRDQWRAVWPCDASEAWWPCAYEWTVEGSVEAWAAVARDDAGVTR